VICLAQRAGTNDLSQAGCRASTRSVYDALITRCDKGVTLPVGAAQYDSLVMTFYEVWDHKSGNLLGSYDEEWDALALVRSLIAQSAPVDSLALTWGGTDPGFGGTKSEGAALLAYAQAMHGHCCRMMDWHLAQTCEMHPEYIDCPDHVIDYWPKSRAYGIIIHDGGSSHYEIHCCPWCGTHLPEQIEDGEPDAE
jgi:hypothetical protein